MSHFDRVCYVDLPLPEAKPGVLSDNEKKIGSLIAENLIPDRACLQMGIGSIPDAVLAALTSHSDLGIHTEMFSDGVFSLLNNGNVTNKYKKHNIGKIVSSFCMGAFISLPACLRFDSICVRG